MGTATDWLGFGFTLTWTSTGCIIGGGREMVSVGVSFWPQINDLFWDVTLFSHLSSCHLLVEGGSGSGVATLGASLDSLSVVLLSVSESDSELLSDSLELPDPTLA